MLQNYLGHYFRIFNRFLIRFSLIEFVILNFGAERTLPCLLMMKIYITHACSRKRILNLYFQLLLCLFILLK